MISSLQADAFVESAAGPRALTVRKAVMHDIAPDPRPDQRLCRQGHHAAAHRIRNVGGHPRFHRGHAGRASCWAAARCISTAPRSPRSARWRSHEHAKTHGVGRKLVEALVDEAEEYELDAVFAFTYVVEFFSKVGFHVVERGVLPLKAWKDCLRCPKFQACDEIAVLRVLTAEHWAGIAIPSFGGQASARPDESDSDPDAPSDLPSIPPK